MELELTGLTRLAQERVAEEARLDPGSEPRARVLDRGEWVAASAATVERLAAPALHRAVASHRRPPAFIEAVGARAGAVELGSILAWLSTKVLGQYDVLVGDAPSLDEDVISYVGPNVVGLEQRFGFDPRQFRLWLALHESAHRAQFTGAPWVRSYFLGLVDEVLGAVPGDAGAILGGLTRAAGEALKGNAPLREHGLVGLVANEDQLAALSRLSALMSVLEGHGEVVMDVAARDLVPDAEHFHSVLRARRADPGAAGRLLGRLLGLDAKMRQYEEGEHFIRTVRAAGGPDLVAELFAGPERLPDLVELRSPERWLVRAGVPSAT